MNSAGQDPQQLDRFIAGVLRALPEQEAPAALEGRVLRELARRAARPWWLQGFGRWPLAARLLFAPVALGFIQLAFLATSGVNRAITVASESGLVTAANQRWHLLADLGHSLQALFDLAVRDIPSAWIYGAAAFAALLYATLFGLSAAAFRSLIATPQAVRN